ncbi:MAG: single-stranded DNA-binding protein [Candidatus Marinimicrobia bacterium]|jgi:single-strand DNA-binding protein|nr:single-stranded DNA-binding protein [FCB group bacterium]MBL7025133.1 single-stranded DNA-binding protein [Candidatus Neomarinimicrobiota bacterium]
MQKNSVNKAIIVGRMGQKPELKYTPAQTAVTNITLATNETRKDASGNNIDSTEWHRIVVFGKTAEFVANYLDKGSLIYVEGRLQTRSWEDRDGVKKYTTEIVALTVTPLGGGSGAGSQGGGRSQENSGGYSGGAPSGGSAPSGNPFGGEDDEPLPF